MPPGPCPSTWGPPASSASRPPASRPSWPWATPSISLFLAILRKIILLIPLIYILPNFFADKCFAVFLAEPVADLLAVCTTATMFFFHFRRTMAALEEPAAG